MLQKALLLTFCVYISFSSVETFTYEEVKCHVCKAVVQEIEDEVSKVNPIKKVDVSGFRLDASGNAIGKSVPMAKSEVFLTEVMEKICGRMDDYLRATYKSNGKFTLLKIMVDGKMNPESSNVNFVQDGDLNKSLAHYCLEILGDHEEAFLGSFQSPVLDEHLGIKICSEQTNYCKEAPTQEDYTFVDKDEL